MTDDQQSTEPQQPFHSYQMTSELRSLLTQLHRAGALSFKSPLLPEDGVQLSAELLPRVIMQLRYTLPDTYTLTQEIVDTLKDYGISTSIIMCSILATLSDDSKLEELTQFTADLIRSNHPSTDSETPMVPTSYEIKENLLECARSATTEEERRQLLLGIVITIASPVLTNWLMNDVAKGVRRTFGD